MAIQIFNTPEVQDFLRLASGLNQSGGNPRAKQIVHRLLSDLFKAIDDLDITSDEYWAGIAYLNTLGARSEAGLLSPGYLDERRKLMSPDRSMGKVGPGVLFAALSGVARDGGRSAGRVLAASGFSNNSPSAETKPCRSSVWVSKSRASAGKVRGSIPMSRRSVPGKGPSITGETGKPARRKSA